MSVAEERADNIRMLRDSAAAVVPRGSDLARIRALRFGMPGFDRDVWREIGEMGWIGLRLPEAAGGAGLGMAEFCALAEELGRGLVPEPLVTGAMAARMLGDATPPALVDGSRIILPAWQERADTVAAGTDTRLDAGRVTGRKVFVPMAAGADAFLVTTREGLALVAADAPGVTLDCAKTQDGGHWGTVTFEAAPAEPVPGTTEAAIEEATLATAAYLLGVMEQGFAMTLEYLRTRKQFGRPIGSFQALQHRAADLKLQIALSRASIESAAATLDAGPLSPRRRAAVSRAKARAADASLLVTRQAIQLHGGIGYTDEYDVGLYLRKAMVLANAFGSAQTHRTRFAALMPEDDDV
ncbi:acyl-CoA dehydrogenase [Aliidongia dinghuensis]|uniref:Acyl-CoA dehydrogenase n=1 Tax=Aliidongia dinghuensis TaxID=1867774 RepID=A0A8J3E321_9PROT|nr:acyl-CoA dehydrogenase family protein [Aliidongia dinghuensis]GGF15498.1 acyl-CoA dehydrogenase [Aliidongia dinghuensis]